MVHQALQLDKTKQTEQLGTYGPFTQAHYKKKFMNKKPLGIGRQQTNKPTQYEPAENSVFRFSLNIIIKVQMSFGK